MVTLLVNFWSKLYSKSLEPQIVPSKGDPKLGSPLRYHPISCTHLWYHLVVSYIRFNAYGNGMGTSLIASLATNRSISLYVTSLLAPKSHSSRLEQNASLITQSSSFAYSNNGFHSICSVA